MKHIFEMNKNLCESIWQLFDCLPTPEMIDEIHKAIELDLESSIIRTETFEFQTKPMAKQSARFAQDKDLPIKKSKTYPKDPDDFKELIKQGKIPASPKARTWPKTNHFKKVDHMSSNEFRELVACENPGTRIISYQDKEVKAYEAELAFLAKGQMRIKKPMDGPLSVHIEVGFECIKSMHDSLKTFAAMPHHQVFKITKPDLPDNLTKPILDALEGIAFVNDARICKFTAKKVYKPRDQIRVVIHQVDVNHHKP